MLITRRAMTAGAALAFVRPARADTAPFAAARQEGSLTWCVAQQDTATAEKFDGPVGLVLVSPMLPQRCASVCYRRSTRRGSPVSQALDRTVPLVPAP
jgi:hypothetical protein